MNERRNFIRGIGMLGAVFAGAATARVVVENKEQPKIKEDISHLQPEDPNTFVLSGNKKPMETIPNYGTSGYVFVPTYEYQNKVHLSVGKDNRLWMKVDDTWMRVSVD